MDSASVNSMICAKKYSVPQAEHFQKKICYFELLRILFSVDKRKHSFCELLQRFQCNGQLGNIID